MIFREPTKRGDKVKLTFVLPSDDDPAEIFVVGDFNAWNVGATKLRRRDGMRSASVTLTTGRQYAFRYYRNGHWFNDDHADAYRRNEYGQQNCIIDLSDA
ncbi:MAG: isoamylase early set domain-containing protein [Actinomycetota bacterium]|jgi:1,4-alpha-glucan branching enzyme|nr:isoamylase early set domain-containing protein [Actinomycetota bacterium]